MPFKQRGSRLVVGLIVVGVILGLELLQQDGVGVPLSAEGSAHGAPSSTRDDGVAAVAEAFAQQRSDVLVEVAARVARVLPDDLEGSRHQRFIVELADGRTLLVAHNIDLAPRVPLDRDQTVVLRGEYEWNEQGGLIHWTHHDPRGSHPGGWIEHAGARYE